MRQLELQLVYVESVWLEGEFQGEIRRKWNITARRERESFPRELPRIHRCDSRLAPIQCEGKIVTLCFQRGAQIIVENHALVDFKMTHCKFKDSFTQRALAFRECFWFRKI